MFIVCSTLHRTRSHPPVPLFDSQPTNTTPDIIMSSIDNNVINTPSKWNINISLQETCEQFDEISLKKRKRAATPVKSADNNDNDNNDDADDTMEDQENNNNVNKQVPIKT